MPVFTEWGGKLWWLNKHIYDLQTKVILFSSAKFSVFFQFFFWYPSLQEGCSNRTKQELPKLEQRKAKRLESQKSYTTNSYNLIALLEIGRRKIWKGNYLFQRNSLLILSMLRSNKNVFSHGTPLKILNIFWLSNTVVRS